MVGRPLRQVKGQTELDLFQDPTERVEGIVPSGLMSAALCAVLEGNNQSAASFMGKLSAQDRYRLRVACRILILESDKVDRNDPS